jgi:hypothetical protein
MSPAPLKRIFRTLFVLLIVAVALAGVALYMAKKYEPEVREIVVYEINRLLDVEVSVEDINLSFFQRFPYASLRFSNVVIPEAYSTGAPDTLLYVKDLYLQISLWDFLRKQYRISEADLNTGFMRMAIFDNGKDNYHFWKSSESPDPAVLSLNDIALNNFKFRYSEGKTLDLSIHLLSAHATGMFGSEVYDLATDCDLVLTKLISQNDILYTDLPLSGNLNLSINNLSKKHELNAPQLKLGNEKMSVQGTYNPELQHEWRIAAKAEDAKIEHIIALLPLNMQKGMRDYKARGRSDIVFEMSDAQNRFLQMDLLFDKTKGSFQHDIALGKAVVDKAAGSLQLRGNVLSLYIDHIHGSLGPGEVKVQGSIRDFNAPQFDLNVDGNLDLQEVRNFFNLDYLDEMKGSLSLTGNFKGKLPEGMASEHLAFLKGIDFDGNMQLSNGALRPRGSSTQFEAVNGSISLHNNAFLVEQASATVNGNAFQFSGKISNALPYLVRDDQQLFIAANFTADHIDLNRLWATSSSTKRDTSYQFNLPEKVSFDFSLDVGKVNFRRFEAEEISGRAVYNNGLLNLNPIAFKLASGRASGKATVERITGSSYSFQSAVKLNEIDISQLFYTFENFSQEMIGHHQISGKADASVTFSATLRRDLSFDYNSILSKIELEVVKGKLKEIKALGDVAAYLRGNLMWRSLVKVDAFGKKLAAIDFDTLRNTIEIRNREVYIPAMRIGSTALTLNLSGKHGFDNQIDYRMSFRLNELFRAGKAKEEEFGYITDDKTGLRLYLQMSGTVDDPIFSVDKEGARQKRKVEFEQEKHTFKSILKEEFGLFKSDSSLTTPGNSQQQKGPVYDVEWDEFDKRTDSLQTPDMKLKKKAGQQSTKDRKYHEYLEKDDDL